MLSGEHRRAVVYSQLEYLSEVQPCVRRVAVVLSHNERLLTAGDRVIGEVFAVDSRVGQNSEQHIVVEERRRQAARGEEESSEFTVKPVGCAGMQFDRENRLRQIHVIIGVEKRV